MTPEAAMERINAVLAHAWMVRTFLKHAEEIQEDPDFLEVPRTIFDYIRAVEPSYKRRDAKEYMRRASGKLSKLRRAALYLTANVARVSDHTNYQMASASLSACVKEIEETLAGLTQTTSTAENRP
jgi:hypothetical protein